MIRVGTARDTRRPLRGHHPLARGGVAASWVPPGSLRKLVLHLDLVTKGCKVLGHCRGGTTIAIQHAVHPFPTEEELENSHGK